MVAKERRRADRRAAALRELASIEEQVRLLRLQQELVARKAIAAGASWREVGRTLGVAGSTAYRRFGGK